MATALSSKVDWRDISRRLNDPKQRRIIVAKTDTEELNRLRTKNAYVKRKRKILDQILKLTNFCSPNPLLSSVVTRPGNGSRPSGPPSTHGVGPSSTHGVGPAAAAGAGAPAAAAAAAADADSDSEVDMGDYERRIRASSAFWRRPDGMSLAEKIIYYRNWKYRPMDDSMERTLADYRRGMRSTRRSAKSAASRHPPSADDEDGADGGSPRRPVSVIPRIMKQRHDGVMFPLIDARSHVPRSRLSRDLRSRDDRLPSIEKNQFVSRKTAETEIDGGGGGGGGGGGDGKNKKKKKRNETSRGPKDPRPNTEPDKLIKKLDRKMEKDLKGLQGENNNDDNDDDDDDDDSEVDEETMNDLLFGEKSKEFDRFLKS